MITTTAPSQVDFVTGNQQAADERAEKLEAALAALKERLAAVDANTTAKEARLQELEGGFGASAGKGGVCGEAGGEKGLGRIAQVHENLQTGRMDGCVD
eukprot:235709-Chlamydomonas_euryale.AAC.2